MRPEIKTTSESDLDSVISVEEPKVSGKRTSTQKYVCSITGCGQTFRRMVHLDRHEYKHTGIRKHACFHDGCSKTYSNLTHLKRHINVSHEKVEKTKDVDCRFEFCDKKFCSVFSMERHIREVHHNPKVYNCKQCEEKFTQKIKLRRHEVKHTGVYPFNCLECSKGFVQECFLHRHICKSYKCDHCQTNFEKWSELIAHRKTSHPKINYKCDQCHKVFSSKSNLSVHKFTHDDDKDVFMCPHDDCTRFYSYKKNLTQHIRTAHKGEHFSCTWEGCEKKLSTKRGLENHIKVIHSKESKTPKQPKKQRLKRKDAGKRKQSTLSKLSGVMMEKDVDKMVMDGTAEIEIDMPAIEEEIQDLLGTTDDDDDHHIVVLKVKEV